MKSTPPLRRQRGLTLLELMISMAIGLVIVLAVTSLFLNTSQTFRTQDDASRLDEAGRFALDTLTRAVRHAGYENWLSEDVGNAPPAFQAGMDPNVQGTDGASFDTLTVRHFGSVQGGAADGTVLDCMGRPVPTDANPNTRVVNAFAVTADGALTCQANGMAAAQTLIGNVERFQLLYGVDTDADGIPNTFVRAGAVTNWANVLSVRIALLLVGGSTTRADLDATNYQLFGAAYADAADTGATLDASALADGQRLRLRRLYTTTVSLRN